MPRLVAITTFVTLLLVASGAMTQDLPRASLPRPEVAVQGPEHYEVRGSDFMRYSLPVTNWREFSTKLFDSAPDLPPCGNNTNASRTWVHIHDASDDRRLYGFCAFA